eukprot:2110299-Amphidinium_carterae.1
MCGISCPIIATASPNKNQGGTQIGTKEESKLHTGDGEVQNRAFVNLVPMLLLRSKALIGKLHMSSGTAP